MAEVFVERRRVPVYSQMVSPPAGMLLTHGAGSDRNHSSLVALENRLDPLPVERVDFPYRKEGRRFPDRAAKLVEFVGDRAAALAAKADTTVDRLVLGGRSMGGRVCSMAVAAGLPAVGLVLVCYPLHPPKNPENLRVEHFRAIDVPCLFVSGDRDPFGSPKEFSAHLPLIAGPVTTVWLEGARHDLAGQDGPICDAVVGWMADLV